MLPGAHRHAFEIEQGGEVVRMRAFDEERDDRGHFGRAAEDAHANIAVAEGLSAVESAPDEVLSVFSAVAAPRMPETLALIEAYLHAARNEPFRDAVSGALSAAKVARKVCSARRVRAGASVETAGRSVSVIFCSYMTGMVHQEILTQSGIRDTWPSRCYDHHALPE